MLIGYGRYTLSISISSSPSGAAFLTSSDALTDGQTGSGTICRWGSGTQNTSSYVKLTCTITSPFGEASPAIGVAGLLNIQGLPEGTLVKAGTTDLIAVSQRLVAGARGELNSWWIPTTITHGTSWSFWIYNDVNGSADIAADTEFAIGELFISRLTSLPTLIKTPGENLVDPLAGNYSSGTNRRRTIRKTVRQLFNTVGLFDINDAFGGASGSSIKSGGYPASNIDLKNLLIELADSNAFAACALPHSRNGIYSTSGDGYLFDPTLIQQTMMLVQPSQLGPIQPVDKGYFTATIRGDEAT